MEVTVNLSGSEIKAIRETLNIRIEDKHDIVFAIHSLIEKTCVQNTPQKEK